MLDPNIDYGKTPFPLGTTTEQIAAWRRARARAPMDQHPLEVSMFNGPGPSPAPPDTAAPPLTYGVADGCGLLQLNQQREDEMTHDEQPLTMPEIN